MKTSTRIVLALFLLLLLGLMAFMAWLPFDPLEEPAGRIDAMIPRDVDSAWRFDGPALLRSPFALTAWDRPEAVELRARFDVEGRVLGPLRRVENAFTSATAGLVDPPGLERDLIPAEVVVATRGDDLLVATRISSRARTIELVRKLPAWRTKQLGIAAEGPCLVVSQGSEHPIYLILYRDVLFASTSRALALDATTLAARGTGGLARDPEFEGALDLDRPAGPHVFGWVRPVPLARRIAPADGTPAPWWRDLLDIPTAKPLRFDIDLSEKAALGATIRLGWRDGAQKALAPLAGAAAGDPRSLAVSAAALAPRDETIASGGLVVSAASVVRALLASQPPERQSAFEEVLASTGETVDGLAASLSKHFDDGIGFAVGRLREADALLGGEDAGAVHAIPVTLVTFRLRGPGADAAVLAEIRNRAESLFAAPLGDTTEVLGDGTRIHVLQRQGLAGQWGLLRPAFAFRGGEFIFCTHEGFLRRSLGHVPLREAIVQIEPRAATGSLPRTLFAVGDASILRRWSDDQAWEAADQATWRDWRAERLRLEPAVPKEIRDRPALVETYLDARIREMKRIRREREMPDVVAQFRREREWLAKLGAGQLSADVTNDGVTLRARVTLAEAK
ncbi:MAG: hypothetical protein K8T90_06215 [Planctomycetes bacterium]|nr:hypothetical protein [Planctomycetota bacterium]